MRKIKKSNKKAFTIVELVVVIAIIAIIAAILVPTFSSVIDNANKSSDTQVCHNINKALQLEKSSGTEIEDEEDVKEIIESAGYDYDEVMPKLSGGKFYWNKATNQFYYVDKDGNLIYPTDAESKAAYEKAKGTADLILIKENTNSNSSSSTNTPGGSTPTNSPAPANVESVSLDKTVITFTTINATEKLTATVLPSEAENKNVTWSSSSESVATVDTDGTVTAKGSGSATITVTTVDGDKKASCSVTVGNEVTALNQTTTQGSTYVLTTDVTTSTAGTAKNNVTLDLNNKTINIPSTADCRLYDTDATNFVLKNGNVTGGKDTKGFLKVKTNGSMTIENTTFTIQNGIGTSGGTLTLNNCHVTNSSTNYTSGNNGALQLSGGGTIIVNGGSYTGTQDKSLSAIITTTGGTLTINSGEFGKPIKVDHPNYTGAKNAELTINGGVFLDKIICLGDASNTGKKVYLTINDGTFGSEQNRNFYIDDLNDNGQHETTHTIKINGGTFYCADDYVNTLKGFVVSGKEVKINGTSYIAP